MNGEPAGFDRLLRDGDRVSVYPVFESLDISTVARLRPRPLRKPRFVLDGHLAKLARYLHMLGFDADCRGDRDDADIARASAEDGRILLTRDRGLLKRSAVTRGYWVRATRPRIQLVEVLRRFDLAALAAPFERCMLCNGRLEPAPRDAVRNRLPPRVRDSQEEVFLCSSCGKLYWAGSHHRAMRRLIEEILAEVAPPARGGG
ncbi:MAG: twitching motility protein PilT [Planctomycetes bacterium]|nr:twitching motility protein PilT [Planctomycetota bacterium]